MAVQWLKLSECEVLRNDGFQSLQIVWPNNAPSARATITWVRMEPGAISKRHRHDTSEQTWIVEQGTGLLLLADGEVQPLGAGDIIRTPPGDTHGVENVDTEPLIYLAVTTPPQDFSSAYERK